MTTAAVEHPRTPLALLHAEPEAERHLPFNREVAAAIRYVVERYQDQPALEAMAAAAGMSPFHFQRVFKRWAGISPKRFLQYVTLAHAKQALADDASVLDAALEAGLSGPSRLHDLFVSCTALTPGEFKALGERLVIRWGVHDVPLGRVLIGATGRGICWLAFIDDEDAPVIAAFEREWRGATLLRDDGATAEAARQAFDLARPAPPRPRSAAAPGARHQLPGQGLGGAAADSVRPPGELPDDRARDRPAHGGACGRPRGRRQQHRLADPLPPGDPGDRDPPQLPLGRAPEAGPGRLRGRARPGQRVRCSRANARVPRPAIR